MIWLRRALLATALLCPGIALAQTTDHVAIPYTDASGGSHSLDSQTNNGKFNFYSQPAVDGTPVTAAAPMPVVTEPGSKVGIDQTTPGTTNNVTLSDSLGHPVAANLNGFLRAVTPGTNLFYEDWASGTFNSTNKWKAAVAAGGGVSVAVTAGTATLVTGTTANGYSYIESAASFQPVAPAFLNIEHAIQLPASAPANTYAFWGVGTSPGTPTAAAPITDGFGFEETTAGALDAVTYAGGSRNLIAVLTRPSDGATHVYFLFVRGDFYWFAIDNIQNVVASQATGANGPNVNTLPVKIEVVAGSIAPGVALTLNSASAWIGDTGNNELGISDGTYPWRKAAVSSAGALKVDPSGGTPADASDGSVAAGTAGTKSGLAGCVYNTSLPSMTNGQQVAEQCDSSGRQIIAPPVLAAGTAAIGTVPPKAATGAWGGSPTTTVGTTAANLTLPTTPTVFLQIINPSASATICIRFGTTATIAGSICGAGSIPLLPNGGAWENPPQFVPTDTISAIASVASTPITIGAN